MISRAENPPQERELSGRLFVTRSGVPFAFGASPRSAEEMQIPKRSEEHTCVTVRSMGLCVNSYD